MKRILSTIVLTLLLSLALLPFLGNVVFAQEERSVESVTVSVTSPVKDEQNKPILKEDVKIQIMEGDSPRTLSAEGNEFALSPDSGWYENNTGTEKKLGEGETFVSGRSYVLRVIFTINLLDCEIDGSTSLYLGNKKATLAKQGEDYEISGTFVCISDRLAPKVSLSVEGETEKVYDGKEILLSAVVQQDEGLEYSYQWYRDEVALENENKSTIKIRNVAQSGEYYCKVSVFVPSEPDESAGVTESAAYEVTITPLPITIQIEDAEKNLFDEDPAFTYTVLGEIFDPLEGTLSRKSGEDIGSYAITRGTLAFAPAFAENYEAEFKEGTLTVLTAGELPFSAVANLADLSYITGTSGAKIRVSASKGALPDGALLSLSFPEDKIQSIMRDMSGDKGVMKSVTVMVLDAKGKEVVLPKHATLRLQIPLSEEEAKQDPKTVTAGFYNGYSDDLTTTFTETAEGVVYIIVEIKTPGTVSLFNGEAKKAVPSPSEPAKAEEKGGSVLLWVLIVSISLLALGGITFTVIWTVKNKKKPESEVKVWPAPSSAPAPEAPKHSGEVPPLPVPETKETPSDQKPAEEVKKEEKKVISFEDLEG